MCEHAARCPGCPLIALPYAEQLAHKAADVTRARARYPALAAVRVLPTLPADPITEYRTRAKLVIGEDGSLGLYEKGAEHVVLDIPGCRVLSPSLALVAKTLRTHLKRHGAAAWRAVDLREVKTPGNVARVLVTIVVERGKELRLESLREEALALASESPSIAGVAANFHDKEGPRILGSETMHLFGETGALDRLGASTQHATFGAFAQAHRGQAKAIHELVARALLEPPKDRRVSVVDLYGGSGAIALALASRGADVTLVESYAPAATHAKEAATQQGLALETIVAETAGALASFVRQKRTFDAAVVNPPRRGIDPAARQALGTLAPEVLAYVSCDPVTLARDLDHLARLGFVIDALQPIDMIPLTDHTETVVVLRRGEAPLPVVLFEDDDVVAVAKAPHEPTTPQGEHATSLLRRVRRLPRFAEAVPIHRLDAGTSGVVFFARDASRVHRFAQALGADSAEKIYVALVRGETTAEGTVDRSLHEGKRTLEATTHWKRIETLGGHSLLEVRPEEGRTHQIRRHLAAIRHPVLGDARYGHPASNRYFEEKHGLDRTFLHCARIAITHPRTRAALVVEAPLAGDLEGVLERLRASTLNK
jgi:23S rRNA (uracil1939-C5)-methyltransferase